MSERDIIDGRESEATEPSTPAEYKATEAAAVAALRDAKTNGGFYVPVQPKLVFVVRIRGTIGVDHKAKKRSSEALIRSTQPAH